MLPSAGTIIRESVQLYRKKFETFWFPILFIFIPNAAFALIRFVTEIFLPTEPEARASILLLAQIPAGLATVWATVVLIQLAGGLLTGTPKPLPELAKESLGKLLSVLWVYALAAAAVVGGFFLLLFPALVFAVWFAFAGFRAIFENERGRAALRASRALVAGRFAPVLWRLAAPATVFSLLVGLASSVAVGILGILAPAVRETLLTSAAVPPGPAAAIDILTSFVSALAAPLFATAHIFLYRALTAGGPAKDTKHETRNTEHEAQNAERTP